MALTRTLALDVGNRRIGVAITDPLGMTAQPLLTIYRTTLRADLKSIGRLVRRYEVTTIVVGHPVHLSGDLSAQALKAEAFAEELRANLPGLPIHLLDERLTTAQAHAILDKSSGARRGAGDRKQRAQIIDQVAAALLLEAWMAVGGPPLLPPPPDPIP